MNAGNFESIEGVSKTTIRKNIEIGLPAVRARLVVTANMLYA
jgi:hypothetical protein